MAEAYVCTYLGSQQLRRGPHRGGRVQRDAGAVDGDARQRLHTGMARGRGGEQEQTRQPRCAFWSHDDAIFLFEMLFRLDRDWSLEIKESTEQLRGRAVFMSARYPYVWDCGRTGWRGGNSNETGGVDSGGTRRDTAVSSFARAHRDSRPAGCNMLVSTF